MQMPEKMRDEEELEKYIREYEEEMKKSTCGWNGCSCVHMYMRISEETGLWGGFA